MPLVDLFCGLALSGVIVAIARRRGSLSPSGAAAALAVGTTIYCGGGWRGFAALVIFFVTSTALARVGRERKAAAKREYSKGDRRDALQVLANGGVAALAALGSILWPGRLQWSALMLGALATANADTWATELGGLSRLEPISLVTLARVPRGTSGAVSPLGLVATVAGAAVIALPFASLQSMMMAVGAGTLGSLSDSLLGATVQTRFYCAACAKETESERHHCGAVTSRVGGLSRFGNDAVNLAATVVGGVVAAVAGTVVGRVSGALAALVL